MHDKNGVELKPGDKARVKIINFGVDEEITIREIPENVVYYISGTNVGSTLSEFVTRIPEVVKDNRGVEIKVGSHVWHTAGRTEYVVTNLNVSGGINVKPVDGGNDGFSMNPHNITVNPHNVMVLA